MPRLLVEPQPLTYTEQFMQRTDAYTLVGLEYNSKTLKTAVPFKKSKGKANKLIKESFKTLSQNRQKSVMLEKWLILLLLDITQPMHQKALEDLLGSTTKSLNIYRP